MSIFLLLFFLFGYILTSIEFSQKNRDFVGVGKRFFDVIKESFTRPAPIATLGCPISVGKIPDKSRPPERRWRYI